MKNNQKITINLPISQIPDVLKFYKKRIEELKKDHEYDPFDNKPNSLILPNGLPINFASKEEINLHIKQCLQKLVYFYNQESINKSIPFELSPVEYLAIGTNLFDKYKKIYKKELDKNIAEYAKKHKLGNTPQDYYRITQSFPAFDFDSMFIHFPISYEPDFSLRKNNKELFDSILNWTPSKKHEIPNIDDVMKVLSEKKVNIVQKKRSKEALDKFYKYLGNDFIKTWFNKENVKLATAITHIGIAKKNNIKFEAYKKTNKTTKMFEKQYNAKLKKDQKKWESNHKIDDLPAPTLPIR